MESVVLVKIRGDGDEIDILMIVADNCNLIVSVAEMVLYGYGECGVSSHVLCNEIAVYIYISGLCRTFKQKEMRF